jgi:hypothetical protein
MSIELMKVGIGVGLAIAAIVIYGFMTGKDWIIWVIGGVWLIWFLATGTWNILSLFN